MQKKGVKNFIENVLEHAADPDVVLTHNAKKYSASGKLKGGAKKLKKVNANSRRSRRANHGYVIFNRKTGKIHKFGISSGNITRAGNSYRATQQVNKLNKNGGNFASATVAHFKQSKSLKMGRENGWYFPRPREPIKGQLTSKGNSICGSVINGFVVRYPNNCRQRNRGTDARQICSVLRYRLHMHI